MYERNWPLIITITVAFILTAVIGWAIGRWSAPDSNTQTHKDSAPAGAVRVVDGVPIGIQHSRPGVLAATDNYVATATETAIQDPARYERLVRQVYSPNYRATALREARAMRDGAPNVVAAYKNGRQGLAIVAARRLDTFGNRRAQVTSWRAGVVWGPADDKPFSQWFLTETNLKWDGQRWLVEKIDDARRPAPSPPIRYADRHALETAAFERELRGMSAPIYGAAG